MAMLVNERGIDFDVKDDYLQEVRLGGGDDELITALKSAKVTKPATFDPAAQARQAEVRQHMVRAADLDRQGQYAKAETEVRAALLLDSQDAYPYASSAYLLMQQKKWDDSVSAGREALRLNPSNDTAHNNLSVALEHKGDWDGAITEAREALRLNPNNELAHHSLGVALGKKGDWDGAIGQEREALRLDSNNELAHVTLGVALERKHNPQEALQEYRKAYELNPQNPDYRRDYERLVKKTRQ